MFVLNLLLLIFILGVIILVHEVGHFLFARRSGVHVYEFAMGMGPVIRSKIGKDGTKYSLRAFPIGGFVSMAGEVNEDDKKLAKDKFMCNKTGLQRFLILASGVIFNIILAFLLFFVYALIWGSYDQRAIIAEVSPGLPMEQAGIVAGDQIVEINGRTTRTWDRAQLVLNMNHEGPFTFTIRHEDGSTSEHAITPELIEMEEGGERPVFGFSIDQTRTSGFFNAVGYATIKLGSVISTMALVIGGLFTGSLSLNALAGPVGIFGVVGDAAAVGIAPIIYLTAFLSVNVAFINSLPFPALDGGRIIFLAVEKIKGSPVNQRIENMFHTIGFILLIALIIYITFQDILRLS